MPKHEAGADPASGSGDLSPDGPDKAGADAPYAGAERQRLDRWIWHARVVRTRSGAAELIRAGHVRLDGARVTSPSQMVRTGQVLTISLDKAARLLRIVGFSERRGDATSASVLFEEITD